MHIKKVSIQNLRSIRHFEMEFEQPAGWHVLIGDNGSGKSSILRGMALVFVGFEEFYILRTDPLDYLNYQKPTGSVLFTMDRDDEDNEYGFSIRREYGDIIPIITVKYLKRYQEMQKSPDKYIKLPSPEGFSASFGPFRRFTGGNPEWDNAFKSNLKSAAHISVFGEDVALTETISWLVNLNYKRLEKDKEATSILKHLKIFINDGKLLPHGAKITNVSSNGVFLTDGNGLEVSVNEMSDGFRSILSMTFEIIRQMVAHFGADEVFESIQDGEIKIDVPGVVMIDEVDAHLHPTWQTEIGFWFTKYFPNIQFIVTTHSPLVCRASERGSIWRLAAPGSGEESREITGLEKEQLIVGNILDAYGTELFGESPVRTKKSDEKRKRLGQLNILHALGKIKDKEETERRELQKILTTDDPTGF